MLFLFWHDLRRISAVYLSRQLIVDGSEKKHVLGYEIGLRAKKVQLKDYFLGFVDAFISEG